MILNQMTHGSADPIMVHCLASLNPANFCVSRCLPFLSFPIASKCLLVKGLLTQLLVLTFFLFFVKLVSASNLWLGH